MEIIEIIIESIVAFVEGMTGVFVTGFQKLFMIESAEGVFSGINNLGAFILTFVGIAFGYGVIRWLTGLFRRRG